METIRAKPLSRVRQRATQLRAELKATRHELAGLVAELPAQGVVITKPSPEVMGQGEIEMEGIPDDGLRGVAKARSTE